MDADDGVERVVVVGNRTGREGEVGYVGSSVVMGVRGGIVRIWGILGRGEERILVVDTKDEPVWVVRLRNRREEGEDDEMNETHGDQ